MFQTNFLEQLSHNPLTSYCMPCVCSRHSSQNPLSVPPPRNTQPRDYSFQPSFDSRGNNASMQPSPPPSSSNFEFSVLGQSTPNTQYNWPASPILTHQGATHNAMDNTKTLQSGANYGGVIPTMLQAQGLGTHESSNLTATGYPARGSNTSHEDMLDTGIFFWNFKKLHLTLMWKEYFHYRQF